MCDFLFTRIAPTALGVPTSTVAVRGTCVTWGLGNTGTRTKDGKDCTVSVLDVPRTVLRLLLRCVPFCMVNVEAKSEMNIMEFT